MNKKLQKELIRFIVDANEHSLNFSGVQENLIKEFRDKKKYTEVVIYAELRRLFDNGFIHAIYDVQHSLKPLQNSQFYVKEKGHDFIRPFIFQHWLKILGVLATLAVIVSAIFDVLGFFR